MRLWRGERTPSPNFGVGEGAARYGPLRTLTRSWTEQSPSLPSPKVGGGDQRRKEYEMRLMRRRELLKLSVAVLAVGLFRDSVAARADEALVLYKDPDCGCCAGHAAYLTEHGFAVTIVETPDLDSLRRQH